MKMSDLKEWITRNSNLVNDNNKKSELVYTAYDELTYKCFINLLSMLLECNIVTSEDILAAYCIVVKLTNYDNKQLFNNESTGEARLQWLIEDIGVWPGITVKSIVSYLKKNHDNYQLKMIPLDPEYWWDDSPDYDLGWFDPKKFKKWGS